MRANRTPFGSIDIYGPFAQRVSKWLLFSFLIGFFQVIFAAAPIMVAPAQAVSTTYNNYNAVQYWVVPEGVIQITVTILGGAGGKGGLDGKSWSGTVGKRGQVTGTISVQPGDTITIAVGGGGVNGQSGVGGSNTLGSGSQAGTNPLTSSYNGGTGGAAGYTGGSGAGAGGGAASILHISGRGYVVAAGAGGSSGGNNIATTNDATRSSAVPSSVSTRTRGNAAGLTGANATAAVNPSNAGVVDGSGSGGGGGGFNGGDSLAPAFDGVDNSEIYGYGGSAGTNSTSGLTGTFSLTSTYELPPALVTSGCHNTTTGWSNYGCGADGSITIDYAPTPTLSQTDSSTVSVQSTAAGTFYLVRDTQTISTLSALDALPSSVMKKVTVAANTPTSLSLSGLSPGAYVGLAYETGGMLSSTTKNTVAAGGDCVPQITSGLTVSHAMAYGYCLISFLGGTGSWTPPTGIKNVSFLAVGGGGGGGENGASGGGGGAMQDVSYLAVTPGVSISVTVGAGGNGGATAGTNEAQGSSGGSSVFGSFTANGGGGGLGGGSRAGGTGGTGGTSNGGTGGGGATAVGVMGAAPTAGPVSYIYGTAKNFGGGGGGGDWQYGTQAGGAGGGGASGVEMQQGASFTNALPNAGGAGIANTGGGGGGGATNYGFGGKGGSGIVVVRYLAPTYKTSVPTNPGMNFGETTTLTTSGTPFSGITRKMQWQASYDTGTTWVSVDSGTIGSSTSYVTPVETVAALTAFQFRVIITDTTSSYTFTTISDTSTLTFFLLPTETDTAISLNGSQYVSSPGTNSPTGTITIEVWVKPNVGACSSGSVYGNVIYKPNAYNIYCNSGNWYANTGNGSTMGTAKVFPYSVIEGEWVHLAIAISGSNLFMFYNGQLVETGVAQTVTANSSAWLIGSQGTTNTYLNGYVDEFRIWNTIRTEAQIQSDMVSNPTITDSALIAYFDFNEGTGNAAYDRDALYISPNTMQLVANSGNISWSLIESTTVSGNYTTVQFPRSIITQKGGWKIPTQVKSAMTLIVSGGGGGGVNAGAGGAGGGGIKGVAAIKSSKGPAKIQVGMGGYGGLKTNATSGGRNGSASILSVADSTVNVQVNGGTGGFAHWTDNPCGAGTTTPSGTVNGGSVQAGYSGISDTTTYIGGAGGALAVYQAAGSNGGAGFTSSLFNGSKLFGGGAGSGSYSNSAIGGMGGGDNGNAYGGRGAGSVTSGDAGIGLTGNGGGGAGNSSCTVIGSPGGSGTVYLKYLNVVKPTIVGPKSDTYTVGTRYKFAVSETLTNVGLTRSYQWQVSSDGGLTWANANAGSDSQTAKYTTDTLTVGMNGPLYQFRCEVTESDSSSISVFAISDTATLTLLTAPSVSGVDSITTTYGTRATTTYTSVDGLGTKKMTVLPGTYGGLLDPVFNAMGYETFTATGATNVMGGISAVQSDGKIITAGTAQISAKYQMVVTRVLADGTPDITWGTTGTVIAGNTNEDFNNASAIYIDSTTGKVTIAGLGAFGPNYGRISIGRFNSDGTLDSTFNSIGYETITVPGTSSGTISNSVHKILVKSDGKIMLFGGTLDPVTNLESSTVIQLLSNGVIDTTFATNGFLRFNIAAGKNWINDAKFLSSGKILVSGAALTAPTSGTSKNISARLNMDGTLDSSFGTGGKTAFNACIASICSGSTNSAQIASDDSIYYAILDNTVAPTYVVTHQLANGQFDTGFANNGFLVDTVTSQIISLTLRLTSAGNIAIAYQYRNSSIDYMGTSIYDMNANRFTKFGVNGFSPAFTGLDGFKFQLSGANYGTTSLTYDALGNLIVTGTTGSIPNYRMTVARVLVNTTGYAAINSKILFDTSTTNSIKITVDTGTPAGYYLGLVMATDSATATGYKQMLITVNKAPGITLTVDTTTVKLAGFDTTTYTQAYSVTGLVAGDTVTTSFRYVGKSNWFWDTVQNYSDTFTIWPKIDTITNGTMADGISFGTSTTSNYLSVTYNKGKLVVGKGTRLGFAIVASDSNTAIGKATNFIYAAAGQGQKIGFIGVRESSTITLTVSGTNCAISATDSYTITTTNGLPATCTLNATISASANYDTGTAPTVTIYFISYINSRDNQTPGGGSVIGLVGGSPLGFIAQIPMTITGYKVSAANGNVLWITGTGFSTTSANNIVRIGRSGLATTVTQADATNLYVTVTGATGYATGSSIGRISIQIGNDYVYAQDIWVAGQPATY